MFCFGVGYDVNARLLDRLSGGNSGTSEYVKPDEDIESHVGRFYSKMTSPVLSDIRLELAGIDINRTYPRDFPDLFEGGQIVWAGRYRQSGKTTIRVSGKVGGERRALEFPAELAGADQGSSYDFVERLWVVRRLGDLIDQIDLHGQNKELVDELVALSTKYGILTPYTSFLADERVQLHARTENAALSRRALLDLNQVDGQFGVDQRGFKQVLYERPASAGRRCAGSQFSPKDEAHGASAKSGSSSSLNLGVSQPAPAAARAEPLSESLSGQKSGTSGMGGMMGGRPALPFRHVAAYAAAGPRVLAEAEFQAHEGKVRQIGAKTFYWKNKRWVDSAVQPDEDAKATVVTQLTDAYFQLARTQKAEFNQYLSQTEPVTVKLDGKVYHVEPAPPEPVR